MKKFNSALTNGCFWLMKNTDKIAKVMCMTMFIVFVVSMFCPVPVMATGDYGVGIITNLINRFLKPWLVAIGACVGLIGLIQFALAFQRQDSEGKSNALLVVAAGCMVAGIGASAPELFKLLQG